MLRNVALHNLFLAFGARDKFTADHCERVTGTAIKIGEILGLNDELLDDLMLAGYLHDIGKIGIPSSILYKPGKLTHREWAYIREHPIISGQLTVHLGNSISTAVQHHHERFNGVGGYPFGIGGTEIPLLSRIISVADALDAMTFGRVYKPSLKIDAMYAELKLEKGKQFDPVVVDAFFDAVWNDQRDLSEEITSFRIEVAHASVG